MQTKQKFFLLGILFLVSVLINISLGSVIIPKKVWTDLFLNHQIPEIYQDLFNYRVLKATTAILTGAGLALSGLFMQSIFKNSIAGPYVLGTSSAAGLGVALLIMGSTFFGNHFVSGYSIAAAAIAGSLASLVLIIIFYYKLKSSVSLLITGLMIGIFAGAIINILSYFSPANALQKYVFWTMGNLGNLDATKLLIMSVLVISGILFSFFTIKELNALLLGDNYAKSMGINLNKTYIQVILITGIMIGSITAFVGPIAFIGLATPHIARSIFKTHMHQILIPAVILLGSVLLLLCDTIAQVPGSSWSLPINSITALFGAPLVIYLIKNYS